MVEFMRTFCVFFRIRPEPLYNIRYLLVIALIFYVAFGLYSTVLVEDSSRGCNCVNNRKLANLNTNLKQELPLSGEADVEERRFKTFLVVVVLTGPANVKRRNAMRSTWLNLTNFASVTRRFVIGTARIGIETRTLLQQERNLHGDLLFLEDLKDEYNELTRKLLKTLIWISKHVECSFVMKVDDDTFARLDVILSELTEKYHAIDNLYWGFHRGNSRVKYTGPWTERKWILCDHYLPYALGGGYIISAKLAHYISNISNLVVLYNSEDVSLGAWLSPINLTRVHDTRFDTEWMSRGCRNVHIVSHKQSVESMFDKFIELREHNQLCKKEEYLQRSFIYSWNVPPSMCCKRKDGIP